MISFLGPNTISESLRDYSTAMVLPVSVAAAERFGLWNTFGSLQGYMPGLGHLVCEIEIM